MKYSKYNSETPKMIIELVILAIIIALLFDFWNGVNDAANSIATIVSTRVLPPRVAVGWAAWWNFAAAFGFGVSVATTIGKSIVNPIVVNETLIMGALIGAILTVALATFMGLPISASHSLIGGLVGAAIAKGGIEVIFIDGLTKVLIFIFIAPLLGMIIGYSVMVLASRVSIHMSVNRHNKMFKRLQLISAAGYSLGHGTNDAQKTMGIIAILLFSAGLLGDEFYVPVWVILAAHTSIALGTLIGGRRVIKTLGMKVTKLRPIGGFSAETAGAVTLLGTALGGIPVSTTHTITGSIIGVGTTKGLSAVKWGVARRIIWAWIATIPLSMTIAAISYYLLSAII